ncbi:class I SAM-dependent methyltransferase [Facklamia sp. DSM 111018]|uniref:Class I SAM-dependent methyltransferase n=1 Tax=Facklamia lactis TaxID=2749967 RepID=A0ABS0LTH1_9LACT|nr:methyltransferase [Facklamia lactis]MBG9981266.1 class I SAM-dependent methyltransferase [Facklamia lactis]MBG9987257.1 class I SAM-dependent methyltransferase [Facklamia lactis]
MSDHYFSEVPNSQHQEQLVETQICGKKFSFYTDAGVFSKGRVDFGSRLLIESFSERYSSINSSSTIVELGSGYGPISIILGSLYPSISVQGYELNGRAVSLAKQNARLNQTPNVEFIQQDVTSIDSIPDSQFVLTNPPIRAGKGVIQTFVDKAKDSLASDGELWLVIQKKQGAPSMEKYMESVFDNVEMVTRSKGYWILRSIRMK